MSAFAGRYRTSPPENARDVNSSPVTLFAPSRPATRIARHGRPLRAPGRHVVAHPLDPDGRAGLARQEHRVGGGVRESGAAVRTGVLHPDHAHAFGRNAEQLGQPLLQRVRLLRPGPDGRQPVGSHVGHRATRPHRRVRLEGKVVAGLDAAHRARQRRGDVAALEGLPGRLRRSGAHVMVQLVAAREGLDRGAPRHRQDLGRADRRPLLAGDDADEIALDHRPDVAGNRLGRRVVHAHQRRSHAVGSHHAPVQHPGHADVGDVAEGAENLRRQVHARDRPAHDPERRRVLRPARALDVQREARSRDLERVVQPGRSGQLAVRHAPRGRALDADDAEVDVELIARHAQAGRCQLQEKAARRRGDVAQRLRPHADRGAAAHPALVVGPRGVAHDEDDAVGRHVELVGDELGEGRLHAHADLHLAGEDVHEAVAIHAEPRVQATGAGRGVGRLRREHPREHGGIQEAEPDQQPSGILDELAAGQSVLRSHALISRGSRVPPPASSHRARRPASRVRPARPGARRRKCRRGCRIGRPGRRTRVESARRSGAERRRGAPWRSAPSRSGSSRTGTPALR